MRPAFLELGRRFAHPLAEQLGGPHGQTDRDCGISNPPSSRRLSSSAQHEHDRRRCAPTGAGAGDEGHGAAQRERTLEEGHESRVGRRPRNKQSRARRGRRGPASTTPSMARKAAPAALGPGSGAEEARLAPRRSTRRMASACCARPRRIKSGLASPHRREGGLGGRDDRIKSGPPLTD